MNCGLWFYHLTFCHVNPFCCILRRQQSSSKQFSVFLGGTLRLFRSLYFSALLVFGIVPGLHAQAGTASEPPRPLVLTEAIATSGVQGRFDHFGFDGKNQLFVAALGNNTVEGDRHQRALAVAYDYGDSESSRRGLCAGREETFCGQQQGEIANLWR